MNIKNMLMFFGVLIIIPTRVDATNFCVNGIFDMNSWAKSLMKIMWSEVKTCLTLESMSSTQSLMAQQLNVLQSRLKEFGKLLEDCFIESSEYTGRHNRTESGLGCMNWSDKSPHDHAQTNFPNGSIEEAGNYCRDPDGTGQPWCYTVDPGVRYENCTVPRCDIFK